MLQEEVIRAENIDSMSPDIPVLLVEDAQGTLYRGQCGGLSCLHPEAIGKLFHLHRADLLKDFLDGPHHRQWCGSIVDRGLRALNNYFAWLAIPLHTTPRWSEEGWVSIEIQPSHLSEE